MGGGAEVDHKKSTGVTVAITGLSNFKISDIDDSGLVYAYYGFLDKDGNWYIMREDITTNAYRYTRGAANYTTNWTNRATLTYDYSNNIW